MIIPAFLERITFRRAFLLLSLFLIGIYLPTLWQGFHFDDYHMVVENQFIKDWRLWPRTFFTPAISSAPVAQGMYRPVLMATYAWNYQIAGLRPIGYHLTNVWMHLLVASLALGLAMRLCPGVRYRWLFLGVLLWAAHPLHVEAVAYISARSSILATLWMVLSLWLYASARGLSPQGTVPRLSQRTVPLLGSVLCYALALGSKEIAITLPGLLLLVEWTVRGRGSSDAAGPGEAGRSSLALTLPRASPSGSVPVRASHADSLLPRTILNLLPFVAVTIGYLFARKGLIGAVGTVKWLRPWDLNARMQLEGILTYLRLWFVPIGQSIVPPQPGGVGIWLWVSGVVVIGLGALAWMARRRLPGATFALGWAGITFLPPALAACLNLVVAEHHAYLPSLGLALGLPPILQWLSSRGTRSSVRPEPAVPLRQAQGERTSRRMNGLLLTCLVLIGTLGVATFQRVQVWQDGFTLWSDAVRKVPKSCMAQNNLGLEYEGRGYLEEAYRCYLRALDLARGPLEESIARNNLGNLFGLVHQPEAALEEFRRCFPLSRYDRALYYNNMGLALSDLKRLPEAQEMYVKALDEDPRLAQAYLNLGVLLFRQDRRKEGGWCFEQAVRFNPDNFLATLALGKFYISQGEFNRAVPVFKRMTVSQSKDPVGYLYLAVSLLRQEPPQVKEGRRCLRYAKALGWEPDPVFLGNLASYLEIEGDGAKAQP